jgi:hypothetical protein
LSRRGFVLLAALLAIVLIGALVTGVMFATREDTMAGSAGVEREAAMIAAESAIAMVVADAAPPLPATIGVSGTTSRSIDAVGRAVTIYMTRLDSTLFLIVGEAVANPSRSGARRRVGVLVNTVHRADGSTTIDPISRRAWSELF